MYSMDSGLHISTSSPHRSSTVSGARPLLARPAVAIVFTSTRNDLAHVFYPNKSIVGGRKTMLAPSATRKQTVAERGRPRQRVGRRGPG